MSTEAQRIEQIIVDHLRREGVDVRQSDGWWVLDTDDDETVDLRRLAEAIADGLRQK